MCLNTKNQEIQRLAEQVKNGNKEAFKHLFDTLWVPLYKHTQGVIMDEYAAKDILQEVWIDYWNRRQTIKTHNIRAYLFRATKYKSFNYLRDKKFTPLQLEALEQLPYEDFTITEEHSGLTTMNRVLQDSMEKLPARCQSIFKMSRLEGYTNDEIAYILNISKRSVENQLSLALKRIKTDLKAHELASVIFILHIL